MGIVNEKFMLKNAGNNLKSFVAGYQSVVAGTGTRVAFMQTTFGGGVNYYNVSNYNRYIAPVTPSANWNSDGVIETINTSGFANVANMGETLDVTYGDEYADKKAEFDANPEEFLANNPLISPDFVVDASTCLFPEYTWFIKDADHVAFLYGTEFSAFAADLILSEVQPTVKTFPEYPRFMVTDELYNLAPLV